MRQWPEPLEFTRGDVADVADIYKKGLAYERARADAAIDRLSKLQKAALRFLASDIAKRHEDYGSVENLAAAVTAVGSLPEGMNQ